MARRTPADRSIAPLPAILLACPRSERSAIHLVIAPASATGSQEISLGVLAAGRPQSGWTALQTTDLPVAFESDSPGGADVATAMNLPSVATGREE